MAARVTVGQLETSQTARFLTLPKALTKKTVEDLFKWVLAESPGAKKVGKEVRVEHGTPADHFVHSFLCYRTTHPVSFLKNTKLAETRYGFLLLIERDSHLVIMHRGAGGAEKPLSKSSAPIARGKLTHAWSKGATYQKISTRRMTVARQELRSAAYEAEDLEAALAPALAARSIPHSIRLSAGKAGVISITPSTGRVQRSGGKANLLALVEFIDATIAELRSKQQSPFLRAFPEPLQLTDLPADVAPTGVLLDIAALRELTTHPTDPCTVKSTDGTPVEPIVEALSTVMELHADQNGWEIRSVQGVVFGRLKRLTDRFSMHSPGARKCVLEDALGGTTPLDRWLGDNAAFSLSFSSPEFFYAYDNLYRRANFAAEVEQVRRRIEAQAAMAKATSEKGGPYGAQSTEFGARSIFGILQNDIGGHSEHFWCCDLGDEWADFISVENSTISFYHCKHGGVTTGASDFQIVVAQALKNLSRIKFRPDEVKAKLKDARTRNHWGKTQIPLLTGSRGNWSQFELEMVRAIGDANAVWRVALVVTALSLDRFDKEAAKPKPAAYFIQLVWLMSSFLSMCRERDAQGVVLCQP